MKIKKTNVVKKVSIDGNQIMEVVNKLLPKMIEIEFSSSYSNPLRDAIKQAFNDEMVVTEIKDIIVAEMKSVRKTKKFKEFVREAMVNKVIDELRR